MSFRRSARSDRDLTAGGGDKSPSGKRRSSDDAPPSQTGGVSSGTSAPVGGGSAKRTTLDVPGAPARERKPSWLSSLKRPKRFSFRSSSSSGGGGGSSKTDGGRENQVHAYVAWINSYLSKVPDTKQVDDLAKDLADGITLVKLIEAVSGEELEGVDRQPSTQSARRSNTQLVIKFMVHHRVKMHHTNGKDVVDGNLKSIMRLVLALAAHYKPTTADGTAAAAGIGTGVAGAIVAGAAGSQEFHQTAKQQQLLQQQQQQQVPSRHQQQPTQHSQSHLGQYPLYVDHVPIMDTSPRRSRSAATLPGSGAAAGGSDPTLRDHDVAGMAIHNHTYRRRSNRLSLHVSPSHSGDFEASAAQPGVRRAISSQIHSNSSSSGYSDPLSPVDPSEVRALVASPGGRKTLPGSEFDRDPQARDSVDGAAMSHFRSRSYTELPSRTANRRSAADSMGGTDPSSVLSPVREGSLQSHSLQTPAVGVATAQDQRQLTARELALEGLPAQSLKTSLSRSTTSPSFGGTYLPLRHAAARPRTVSPIQPVMSGELLVKHLEMEEDVRLFKEMLYELQHSLLTGLPADLASVQDMMDMPDEVVLLQARLDQKTRTVDRLEESLVKTEVERDHLRSSATATTAATTATTDTGTAAVKTASDSSFSAAAHDFEAHLFASTAAAAGGASPMVTRRATSKSREPSPVTARKTTSLPSSTAAASAVAEPFLASRPLDVQQERVGVLAKAFLSSSPIPSIHVTHESSHSGDGGGSFQSRDGGNTGASPAGQQEEDESDAVDTSTTSATSQITLVLLEKQNEIESLSEQVRMAATDKKSMEIAVEEAEKEVLEKKQTLLLLNNELEERDEEIAELRKQVQSLKLHSGDTGDRDRPSALPLGTVTSSEESGIVMGGSERTAELLSDSSPLLPGERLQGVGADNPDSLPRSRPPSTLSFNRPSPPPYMKGLDLMAYNSVLSALERMTHISNSCALPEEFSKKLLLAHEDLSSAVEKMERAARSPTKRRRASSNAVQGLHTSPTKTSSPNSGMAASIGTRHIVGQESPKPAVTSFSTTVVYYMDQVQTPFKTSIPKRSERLTLRDFKDTVDRPGVFRYHFKTVDPEFGTVKEELSEDGDGLPLWDGKVVGWIEEDASIV